MMNTEETIDLTTVALAVPWCPWIPERAASMDRLRAALGPLEPNSVVFYREFGEQLPNDQWSGQVFEWLSECAMVGVAWCMQIQEDALIPDNFLQIVQAIFTGVPDYADIIGFHVCHPIAGALAEDDVRLFTTSDALVGLCWAMRGKTAIEFRQWRATQLHAGWREPTPGKGLPSITEDTMIGLFAMATGRKIYHTIPAVVDHDTSMRSVWGNDDHQNRRPVVSWKDGGKFGNIWNQDLDPGLLEGAGFWMGRCRLMLHRNPDGSPNGWRRAYSLDPEVLQGRSRIPHVGRFYEATPVLARRWIKGFGERELVATKSDTGGREKRRLVHVRRAKVDYEARKRVLVCTPTRGGTDPQYTRSMLALAQLFDVDIDHGFELLDSWSWHEDLVRVRSRFVRKFLETDATHLHFRDGDVIGDPRVLLGLLRADKPFVAAPYPRRAGVDWTRLREAVKSGEPAELEAAAYDYPVGFLPGEANLEPDTGCVQVRTAPIGCSLISRECLEQMIDHYRSLDARRIDLGSQWADSTVGELEDRVALLESELRRWRAGHMGLRFADLDENRQPRETLALFQLLPRLESPELELPILQSEDGSFCTRLRDMGGEVWLYLGPGSPVDHAGDHLYRGQLEYFGLRRGPAPIVATT